MLQSQPQIWKDFRRNIVRELLAFCEIDDASWYTSIAPESFFTPMKDVDLSRFSLATQEQLFIRDLLLVYSGLQGENVRFVLSNESVEWTVNPSADDSLRKRLYSDGGLPLAALLIVLQRYIKALSCDLSRGRTAVTVAVMAGEFFRNEVLASVRSLEAGMRNGTQLLNIFAITSKMHQFLHTVKELLTVLSTIYKRDLIGGEILSFLNERTQLCVLPSTTSLLLKLERGALKQYLKMVFSWIRYGSLLDDYSHEFMIWDLERVGHFARAQVLGIEEAEKVAFDGLEDRFCIVNALCPSQLKDVFTEIVNCGKYMKIIQKLDTDGEGVVGEAGDSDILQDWEDKGIEDIRREIKQMRNRMSEQLVLKLKKTFEMENLVDTLHSFFFLEYSDWLHQFFDLTENILPYPVDSAMAKKVQIYFEEAVSVSSLRVFNLRKLMRVSFEKCDVFTLYRMISNLSSLPAGQEAEELTEASMTAERMNATLQSYSVREELNGAAKLSLKVELRSPMTLVFPFRILLKYEQVFRTLFCLHRAIHLLYGKQLLEDLIGEERAMLQNMLHVLNGYLSHCVTNVIPTLSRIFLSKLAKSSSLEEIISHQATFFDQLFEKCFFGDIDFTNNLSDLINSVIGYSTDLKSYDQAAFQWKMVSDRLNNILVRPSNNSAYSQLHVRLFSRIC